MVVGSRFLNPSPALLGAGVTFLCSSVSLGQSTDHLSNEGQRSVQCRAVEGQWRQWDGDKAKRVDGKLSSSVNFDNQQANPQPPHLLQKTHQDVPILIPPWHPHHLRAGGLGGVVSTLAVYPHRCHCCQDTV